MRRGRRPATATITAAATRIDLSKLTVPRTSGSSGGWQEEAWGYHDTVPEVSFATTFTGTSLAKLRLYAAVRPLDGDVDADPVAVTDPKSGVPTDIAAAAQGLVDRLRSLSGGQAEILREFNINWEVVGECYLIGWAARPLPGDPPEAEAAPEWWEIRSKDEILVRDARKRDGTMGAVMFARDDESMPVEAQREVVEGFDSAIRLWQRHPRWSGRAHCALRACLGELRTLQVLSGQVMAESMSRHNAGVMFVPNEVELDKVPTNDPDGEEDVPKISFSEGLARALIAPITDPSNPASVVPVIAKVPGEYVDKIKHVQLSRESTDTEAKIKARLERLGHGLNLPPEVISGHMQTTFANAEQIDEDTFADYLEPRATLMVQGLTFACMTPDLAAMFPAAGDVVSRVFIWYDASDLIGDPDPIEGADSGWDRGLLSDAAWRKHRGYDEGDAPDDAEKAARLEWMKSSKASAPAPGAPGAPDAAPTPEPSVTPAPPEPPTPAGASRNGRHGLHRRSTRAAVLTAARGQTRLGAQLVGIDRNLRERLVVLADSTMRQALDRAGNRAVNRLGRTQKAALAAVAPGVRVAHIGPVMLADAGLTSDDLLDGAFEAMRPQFMAWGAGAQDDAFEAVSRAVSGLSLAERDIIKARQASSLTEAWGWLESTLTHLARARLFDPSPSAPALGEHDSSMNVPAGILRSAMAQAGGATGLQIDEGRGVWLPLNQGGQQPAGGIATGEQMTDVLVGHGATLDGYQWVYGPAHRTRPFDPHAELDGVEFANFDDDVLANSDSFPEYGFYMPGDHPGCICDFEPIVLPAP